jgi:hypothetical protein
MAKASIPAGITPEQFVDIKNFLANVLEELGTAAPRARPMWASCRLNESRDDVSPIFVGWVEHPLLRQQRIRRNEPDPGLFRFGDDHYSQIYEECVNEPGVVKKRDWKRDLRDPVKGRWMFNANKSSVEAGVMYRRSIGIAVDSRSIGTLNVGFAGKPNGADRKIATVMKKWASPDYEFVSYLRDNFELAGPPAGKRTARRR